MDQHFVFTSSRIDVDTLHVGSPFIDTQVSAIETGDFVFEESAERVETLTLYRLDENAQLTLVQTWTRKRTDLDILHEMVSET
jgi:hypothetical protein